MKKLYEFPLPVHKQGDDLAGHVEHCNTHREALLSLAEQFEVAADLCRRVARKAGDDFSVECAEAHMVIISDEESRMEPLEEDEVLFEVKEDVCEECKTKLN